MNVMTALLIFAGAFFALAISGAVTLYVLGIFYDPTSATGIFTAGSASANFTTDVSSAIDNISLQLPNAGRLLGVVAIIGVVGLMGIGGYMGYRHAQSKGYM